MKKSNYFKKAIQNFKIFISLTVVFAMLIIPCYNRLLNSAKNTAIENFDRRIMQEIKTIEYEINMQKNMLKNITGSDDFKILSNPAAYGVDLNSVEWVESRERVQKSYSVLRSVVSLQNKSFLAFRNSDMTIDTNGAIDQLRYGYDTVWRLSVNQESYSTDSAMAQLFSKKHSGDFDGSLCYVDVTTGENYELVYALTLSSFSEDVADVVFVACYDVEDILEGLGMSDETLSIMFTTFDNAVIHTEGNEYDISVYDSCCENEGLNLKVHYSISDMYLKEQLAPINLFLIIFALGFIVFGILATVGVSIMENRHLKKMMNVVKKVTDVEYSGEDDYFKYLETIFSKLYVKNKNLSETIKELVFYKLLHFKLSDDEFEHIPQHFSASGCIVVLKNTSPKYNNLRHDVFQYLKNNNIQGTYIVETTDSEIVVFAKKTNIIKDVFEDVIVFLNKEHRINIKGMAAYFDDVTSVPDIYEKIRKKIQYIEYGSFKLIDNSDDVVDVEDFKAFMTKGRQLYEIVRSGNEFEAKRIVYEQWYKITQGELSSSAIEPLFFSQTTMLTQISTDFKLNIAVPRFDSSKDVVSIAFEITECIEQICERLKGNAKKEDVRGSQIIEYIEQRYCDSAFYMPELVGKFELSDRAIVQMLKKTTGDNFSNYVSKLRISKAQELLTTTGLSVAEVATASGFDSSNSLYKAFKKVYGVSPSVYRENRKNSDEE